MKKNAFLIIFVGLMPFIAFSQRPSLKENFEKFSISTPQPKVEIPSTVLLKGNGVKLSVVANPEKSGINRSNLVLQLDRPVNPNIGTGEGQQRPGLYLGRGVSSDSYDLEMSDKQCVVEFKILKKVAGQVGVRIASAANPKWIRILSKDLPASDKWQLVRLDFSGKFEPNVIYSKLLLEMHSTNTLEDQTSEISILIDDIKLTTK